DENHSFIGRTEMLVCVNCDSPLRNQGIPVPGASLSILVGAFISLSHKIYFADPNHFASSFAAGIDDTIEMAKAHGPTMGVVDGNDPACDPGAQRECFSRSIHESCAELSGIGQDHIARSYPEILVAPPCRDRKEPYRC